MTTRYVYLCAEGRGDKGSLGDPMASGSSDEGVFQPLLRRALEGHHIEFRPGFEGLSLGADVPTSIVAATKR